MGTPVEVVKAHCIKCKDLRWMSNLEKITMKNGRPAYQGNCPLCRTKMFKIDAVVWHTSEEKEKKPKVTNKRPPTKVHIKDVETALHNLFCQDIGKNRINREAGLDLFESHRKAANTLIDQLKLQGIKLVPDPDFEDKPKICTHISISIREGTPKRTVGYKCVICQQEARFKD